ncbi:pyridoxamine 5-phosphate oxidase [Glycomyces fuscus]|nr:pyridoxamine 5-phosphate oxidase [Glycomyces fuscus]
MTGYHPGELEVQHRAALTDQAAFSAGAVRQEIPDVAADFLAAQTLLVVGAADERLDMWCSLLTGPPGFLRARDGHTLDAAALPRPGDPLAGVLGRGSTPLGAVAIEPATRRRMRINGTAVRHGDGLRIRTAQVFANCPKYIQKRTLSPVPADRGPVVGADRLTEEQVNLLGRADTFFVATADSTGDADANHRGGAPGFLRVHSPTLLSWPDYVGNAMFNTLGNLRLNPRAGLLVPDWETGGLLQLTGTARTLWGDGPGDRRVEFALDRLVAAPSGGLRSEGAPHYSRFNPPIAPTDPRGALR